MIRYRLPASAERVAWAFSRRTPIATLGTKVQAARSACWNRITSPPTMGTRTWTSPNRFVASTNYQLPFKTAGRLNTLVEGWQLNGIIEFYDGFPFSVFASSGVGDGLAPRAQFVTGNGNGSLSSSSRTLQRWFNTAAFANPAAGTWGKSGRNILQGPGTRDVDFAIFKNTQISESKVLQLHAEFFNLLNTRQFNNPGATVSAATLGRVSSAGNEPLFQRLELQVQLAAKISV